MWLFFARERNSLLEDILKLCAVEFLHLVYRNNLHCGISSGKNIPTHNKTALSQPKGNCWWQWLQKNTWALIRLFQRDTWPNWRDAHEREFIFRVTATATAAAAGEREREKQKSQQLPEENGLWQYFAPDRGKNGALRPSSRRRIKDLVRDAAGTNLVCTRRHASCAPLRPASPHTHTVLWERSDLHGNAERQKRRICIRSAAGCGALRAWKHAPFSGTFQISRKWWSHVSFHSLSLVKRFVWVS